MSIFTDVAAFCSPVGTATLESPYFDPAYFKGSTLRFINPKDGSETDITPVFNYYEVAADGTITDQGTTEPATAITVNVDDCENFTAAVYLKYAVDEDGAAT